MFEDWLYRVYILRWKTTEIVNFDNLSVLCYHLEVFLRFFNMLLIFGTKRSMPATCISGKYIWIKVCN